MFEEEDTVIVIATNKTGVIKYVAPVGNEKMYYVIENDDANEHHFYKEYEIKSI